MLLKIFAATILGFPFAASAHTGEPLQPHDLFTFEAWVGDPFVLVPLLLAACLYWRGNKPGRGICPWEARCYWAGWTLLAIALVSPVHTVGEVLFSAHMAQHELIMLAAAPLLVLGRPLVPYVWALPLEWRRAVAAPLAEPTAASLWRWATQPFHAWWIHGVALWAWHIPLLYQATISSDLVHILQHLSFLLSALLFWWSLLRNPRARGQHGVAAMYVFGTALHSSILGALLTFAPSLWYPVYGRTAEAWGLTALEDQQLGGLIMWIPAGIVYTAAGLAFVAAWLRESETQVLGERTARAAQILGIMVAMIVLASCTRSDRAAAIALTGGSPERGSVLIGYYGCGSCHEIPGVPRAGGLVGPSLRRIAVRAYVAGILPNTPENLVRWIRDPQSIDDHTVMPTMDVTAVDARDIAAYLYTLR